MAEENGVWRTVRGRRVFIRDGEDLASAMKRSGKFGTKFSPEETQRLKEQGRQARARAIDKANNENRTFEQVDKEWMDLAHKMEKDYDEYGTTNWKDEKRLNELSLERDTVRYKDEDDEFLDKVWEHHLQEAKERGMTPEELSDLKTKEGIARDGMLVPIDPYSPKEEIERILNIEKDSSPMSEWSDTTGTGLSDKQSSVLNKMSLIELRNMANEYDINTKGKSKKQLLSALISMFNK